MFLFVQLTKQLNPTNFIISGCKRGIEGQSPFEFKLDFIAKRIRQDIVNLVMKEPMIRIGHKYQQTLVLKVENEFQF